MSTKNTEIVQQIKELARQIDPEDWDRHEMGLILIVAEHDDDKPEPEAMKISLMATLGCPHCILPLSLTVAGTHDSGFRKAIKEAAANLINPLGTLLNRILTSNYSFKSDANPQNN